jgi:hypothetical protein
LNTSSAIIRTYPNPVHNQLTVIFGNLSSKASLLKITDVNGKQVYLQKIGTTNSPLQNIDVSGFAKGTYFIQVISGKETHVSKFVKQ